MEDTARIHRPPDDTPDETRDNIHIVPSSRKPKLKNIVPFVVSTKKTKRTIAHSNPNYPSSQKNLIELTEQLAADAKSGKLRGLGGFTEYDDGYYDFGLEGSYLSDPGSAILPLRRLERRIMTQIDEEE